VTLAAIFGLEGPRLLPAEAAFFAKVQPWGFILFGRNIETPDQVRALTAALRTCVGRPEAPILIDQEGGRVQRLGPPHWPAYPPGEVYGRLGDAAGAGPDFAWLGARLIAHDLAALGITVDCAPVADVPVRGAHDIIGDRAYGDTPDAVAALAGAFARGLMAGGVLPVVKHIPGHGRAGADSHKALPVVETALDELEATDFAAFRALKDLPMAMTAHVVFAALDPDQSATTSAKVIAEGIRGRIGFDGLLMSDDLSMDALSGSLASRARASLAAGCDVVLHCNGSLTEMAEVVSGTGLLTGRAAERAAAALAALPKTPPAFDVEAGRRRLAAALTGLRGP
jgi:beta-N-acetylhexosaminidase